MCAYTAALAQTDSLYIKESAITAARSGGLAIPSESGVILDMNQVKTLPMMLGTADPLALAHYLPSMSAQSEIESGIHIQGNDHSHNLVSSGGVPIYGASHILGLYSVFNPSHYAQMDYRTSAPMVNRLGGQLDMSLPDSLVRQFGGEASLGLMAVQGTLRIPMGKRLSATVSVRRTFFNLLYSHFLQVEKSRVKYGFTDVNLTMQWQPTHKDRLWLDAYYGSDAIAVDSGQLLADLNMGWRNGMAALHWEHAFDQSRLHQRLYFTRYGLNLNMAWATMQGQLPSHLQTLGYRADWTRGGWTAGLESAYHQAQPQSPVATGVGNESYRPQPLQHAWENTLFGRYTATWGRYSLTAGLKGSLYLTPEKGWYARLDPDLQAKADFYRGGVLELGVGLQHQYLFQTGFANTGLPTQYWFLAGEKYLPQQALSVMLNYSLRFGRNDAYRLSVNAYHKWLSNQVEYVGNLLQLISSEYDPDAVLLTGTGRAYGVNLSLHKTAGAFTGWIAYAWGRSLRTFDHPSYPGEYPATFERIHELDAVASWTLGRWTLGGTFVLASGTPFTEVQHIFLMGHQLMAQYGPHNGRRLAPYLRLDLSVSFFFHRGPRQENGLNFSLYNATGHVNELCYQLRTHEGEFVYAPLDFNIRFMPSLCYFHKF